MRNLLLLPRSWQQRSKEHCSVRLFGHVPALKSQRLTPSPSFSPLSLMDSFSRGFWAATAPRPEPVGQPQFSGAAFPGGNPAGISARTPLPPPRFGGGSPGLRPTGRGARGVGVLRAGGRDAPPAAWVGGNGWDREGIPPPPGPRIARLLGRGPPICRLGRVRAGGEKGKSSSSHPRAICRPPLPPAARCPQIGARSRFGPQIANNVYYNSNI